MMEQAGVLRASVCAVVVCVVAATFAKDESSPAAAEQKPAAEAQKPAQPAESQQLDKIFEPLFRVANVQGACEVKNPDVGHFVPVINNKAYPLGTAVRTGADGSAVIILSNQENVQLLENTEVTVAAASKNPNGRALRFVSGKIKTTLRDNLPEGCFSVETANTNCRNIAGRGEFTLTTEANLETFQAATITGSELVEGLQFHIPALRAANTVNIQTAQDRSLSRLTSVSGDFAMSLENGTETPVSYGMSPKAVVKIWRENAPVGGRTIVSTLVISPTGKAIHRFAYAEGRTSLTTGELISQQEGEEKEKKEELPVLLTTQGTPSGLPAEKSAEKTSAEK